MPYSLFCPTACDQCKVSHAYALSGVCKLQNMLSCTAGHLDTRLLQHYKVLYTNHIMIVHGWYLQCTSALPNNPHSLCDIDTSVTGSLLHLHVLSGCIVLQVVQLYGLQKGFFDNCNSSNVQASVEAVVQSLKQTHPDALERIKRTHSLGPMAEAVLKAALEETCKLHNNSVSVPTV